jgi:hypothetical protein
MKNKKAIDRSDTVRIGQSAKSDCDRNQTTLQRHYCNRCRRKRYEYLMRDIGPAVFGKRKWACAGVEQKFCLELQRIIQQR